MPDNETHVIYKALADFSNLRKEARKAKKEFAELKAAEQAFNAASNKNSSAAANALKSRTAALNANKKALGTSTTALAKQLVQIRAATKAIQAQNRSLATNAERLTAAAAAASAYAAAQRKIAARTGKAVDTKALRNEASSRRAVTKATEDQTEAIDANTASYKRGKKAVVEFVEDVGEVDQATGEVTKSIDKTTKSTNGWSAALAKVREHLRGASQDSQRLARAREVLDRARYREADSIESVRIAEMRLSEVRSKYGSASAAVASAEQRLERANYRMQTAMESARLAQEAFNTESRRTNSALRQVADGGERVRRSFVRLGNWRPRLTPSFIALVPIIGAVMASINDLIALLGGAGAAALALAGNIASLSGVFLALPGILSAVVGGIASVIASMGGVGTVFKTYTAMNKALGKVSGGGQSQAERAEQLADAERNLAKAQRNVQKAQESLNKARQQALEDLIELRREVGRASLNEERAIADLQLAREAYNNVMADPGSTAGDKLDAAARIKEAEAQLEDVRRANIENQKALTEAERRGVDQSEKVLDAQDSLADAYDAQADALRNLRKEQNGGSAGAAAVQAVNEYEEALAKLSPSARAVVLALIALQDQWKAMRSDLQENFFSQFVNDTERLPRLIQVLGTVLRPTSVSMGKFVSNFLRLVDSPEWSRDLSTIGEQNATVLDRLGDAALYLMTALKDLTIAAGPFTEWMVTGFAEGSKEFSEFIANARETGSLASWLEKVESRLQQWWRIIKNIGSTLFNYSAAAAPLGQWLTDGLEKTTQAWQRASEAARKEGSPFQEYINSPELKAMLSEVKGVFGDFFRWFGRESMEVGNIQGVTRLLQILRNDVGPALADVFDTLAETNVDEQFLHAISRIIEFIDSLMRAGGNAVLTSFFDVVTGFFDTLAGFFNLLPPGSLAVLGTFLGTVAALSFIGKFTGITNMVGGLLSLVPHTGKLGGFFGMLSQINGMKFLGVIGLIAAAPALVSTLRDGLNSLAGLESKSIGQAAANYERLAKSNPMAEAWKQIEATQWRNPLWDVAADVLGDRSQWKKVDDQLRAILDTGDLDAFRDAWAEVVNVVGGDATQIWSLVYKDAQNAGAELEGTSEKIRVLGEESETSEQRIRDLRSELDLIGGGAMSQGQALDTLAKSIQRLGELPPITVGELNSQTDSARALRDQFRNIETNARNAAQAILDNGGSIEEAQAAYDDGRKAIEDYLVQLGLGPEEARIWADGQLGPAEEVRQKFADIKSEMDKIETNKKIQFELVWYNLLGQDGPDFDQFGNPLTSVNGRRVVDFYALGQGKGTTPSNQPSPSPGPSPTPVGGGAGGGFSVGLAAGIKKETTEADSTWKDFWANFTAPIGGPLGSLFTSIVSTFSNIKTQGTDPLKANTKGALADIQSNGFVPFRNAASGLPGFFGVIVSGISSAWDRLREAFRAPINFVINTVYTNGIQKFWNPINDALRLNMRLPDVRFAEGGVLPGYTPGRDVHNFVSPTGGRLALSGGEAIMRPEFTRAVGGRKGVDELNRKARRGEAFATGGIFGPAPRPSGEIGGPLDWFEDAAAKFVGFFTNPARFIADGVGNLVSGLLGQMPGAGSNYAAMLSTMPRQIIDAMVKKGQDETLPGKQIGGSANAMGWRAQWAAVRSAFPSANLNSSVRSVAQNARVGGVSNSYHVLGRAIDVTPSMAIFNWIRENFPNSRELIYSPAGNRQLQNGRNYFWPEPIRSQHYNHVHWAMKKGGVLPQLFDEGGMLRHGQLGMNLSGKPEAVLDPQQTSALQTLLSGVGLLQRQMLTMPGQASQIASQAPQIVDNSVNIENLTIQNAVPEKPSESLPKSLRKIGYMQSARGED